jgi:hypothetical protein
MNNKSDKREFERFLVDFVLEVSAEDIEGNKYDDKTVLKNISGGHIHRAIQVLVKRVKEQ